VTEAPALTCDAFLGGRVRLWQPLQGYRAATDPVLLAAACPAKPGERVLDLGCGAGAAALCLAARVADLDLHGLELQPGYAALARRNAAENGARLTVHEGDVAAPPAALRGLSFDHAIMNPPYFAEADAPSPDPARDAARREAAGGVGVWVAAGLRRLRQGGWLTVVHRVERLPEILAAAAGKAGGVAVLPLAPREGRAPTRMLVKMRKDGRAPFRIAFPLVLHARPTHICDGDDFSPEAVAALRDGAALDF
jgi:tRNA1(Val) A37 N6-methylase TrmN6